MESLTSGTLAGTGTFRCEICGHVLEMATADVLPACPGCDGASFTRASLFAGTGRFQRAEPETPTEGDAVDAARDAIDTPGRYLVFHDAGTMRLVPLEREWTRIGRSLAADVRFDDPTVSRRHALIVAEPGKQLRVLDDRSLNGVFVNGVRSELKSLRHGDELAIGRFRLYFLRS